MDAELSGFVIYVKAMLLLYNLNDYTVKPGVNHFFTPKQK